MIKIQALLKTLSGLSKREKTILYATALVVFLVVVDRLIVYPIYSKFRSLNNEIKEKEKGIVSGLKMLSQEEKIVLESKKYASYLAKPASEEEAMTSFLKEVENLANKSSLYIVDMKPAGVKQEKDNMKRFQLVLNCEGQMEQLIEFMYGIDNLDALLSIDRYQISPKSKDSTIVQCTVTISKITIL